MLHHPTLFDPNREGYGFLQKTDKGLFHPGVDYNNGYGDQDRGQEVWAPTWGTVEYVSPIGTNGGLGNYFVLCHPHNNAWTRYMHLEKIIVHIGETVYPKQICAYLGDTGTVSSHLHSEALTAEGIEFIKNYHRPYGRYSGGLSQDQVLRYWKDPIQWIETENHYVGPDHQKKLMQAQNALRWATGLRRNMLLRLIERLTRLL